ncbi:MAG TPA: endonuclease/exonuclease/phosphatase family protein [Phycisphaerae bacterium]|nr:endonuclease/exonuclease/phosphatase family protein [Phycisphaerae bacterium]
MLIRNATTMLLACGCILALFAAGGGCAPQPPTLHVATLNIAHGRGPGFNPVNLSDASFRNNLDRIAQVLLRERPDVVALQEIDAGSFWSGGFDHTHYLQQAAGFTHRHLGLHVDAEKMGMRLQYGTALLARQPLDSPTSHAFHLDALDTKGFVTARVKLDGRPLLVVSVHLDARTAKRRRQQAQHLIDRLPMAGLPIVLLGDLNSTWNDDGATRLLAQHLHLRAYEPDSSQWPTFPSTEPADRIDWIMISPQLEFVEHRLWPDRVSDHLGLTAILRWRQ